MPTYADAQDLPARNRAYCLPVFLVDTNGAPITASWTSPSVVVSNDGSAALGASFTLHQVTGTNQGYILFDAATMNAPLVMVTVTVSGSMPFHAAIPTTDLSDTPGADPTRFDRMFAWLFRRWRNRRASDGRSLTVYSDDDASVFSSGGTTQYDGSRMS